MSKADLPVGWETIKLGDVSKRMHQGINTTADKIEYQNSGVPIIQAKHITSETLNFDGARFVSQETFDSYKQKYYPRIGNILFSNIGTIGRSLVVKQDANFLIAWNALLIELVEGYDPFYINAYLQYLNRGGYFEKLNTGNAAKFINSDSMKSVALDIPPLLEQRKIAKILSTWDEAIAKTEQLIAALQIRKKGLMQRLLSGEVRFEGFDGEWRETNVKNVFTLGRGRVISQKYIAKHLGDYPVYSSQTSNNGVMGKISTFEFEGEYITWTTDGANAGTVFYRKGKFNCTNVCGTLKALRENEIDLRFVAYQLGTIAKRFVSYVGNPKLMNNIFLVT